MLNQDPDHPDDKAAALVAEIKSVYDIPTSKVPRDLSDALYTLSEGCQIHIDEEQAHFVWQLVEYLRHNPLDAKYKL